MTLFGGWLGVGGSGEGWGLDGEGGSSSNSRRWASQNALAAAGIDSGQQQRGAATDP